MECFESRRGFMVYKLRIFLNLTEIIFVPFLKAVKRLMNIHKKSGYIYAKPIIIKRR